MSRQNEQERLKNDEIQARVDIQREFEELRLKKEALWNTMKREQPADCDGNRRKKVADVTQDLELCEHNLDMIMQENMENKQQQENRILVSCCNREPEIIMESGEIWSI